MTGETASEHPAEPAHVVVVGAGVAGLGTALALGRAGHRVTVLERDATPLPADPDAAFAWDRRGAPQVRHSHALLARLRNLLRDRYPDVLAELLAAGASELVFSEMMPDTIDDRSPRPGDEDLVAIACRRTTFEWVLRRMVLAEEHVDLCDGVAATGLLAEPDPQTGRPRVAGVTVGPGRGQDGPTQHVPADLVVAAAGRRTGGPGWLEALGAAPEVVEEDTGIVYFSRFYRLLDGAEPPAQDGPIGGDLGYLKYAVFQGDNRTFSVTFAVGTHDDELRSRLLHPEAFDDAARVLPATGPWVDPARAEPITEVHVMGGLLNRLIRHLDDDGEPLVTGYLAVGDAHTCTNPLYGRGCSLAMVQADLLADALAGADLGDPDGLAALARAYEAASAREVEPWYRAAVTQDRMARRAAEEDAAAEDGARPAAADDATADGAEDPEATQRRFLREVMRDGLLPAVRTDAVVFRAFLRGLNLLDDPDALLADGDVIGRVLAVYQDRENRPPEPSLGPPRHEMLAALDAA